MACGSVRISVSKRAIDNKCGPHSGPYVTVQVEEQLVRGAGLTDDREACYTDRKAEFGTLCGAR